MSLINTLEEAITLAKNDSRIWIQNELRGILNRVRVTGGDAKDNAASPLTAPKADKSGKTWNIKKYPTDHSGELIDPKKKSAKDAVDSTRELKAIQEDSQVKLMALMSEAELDKHFPSIAAIKDEITRLGGDIHSRASRAISLSVLSDLVKGLSKGQNNDEEE